jgi:hemolysin III
MNTKIENFGPIKPFLRGHFHQAAFFFALGACALLLSQTSHLFSAGIYSLSLCSLFGISALYHRPNWSHKKRQWMRRLDHAAIFVLIAGTSTPICLIALPEPIGWKLFNMTWVVCSFGVFQSLCWPNTPKWLSAILYLAAGWMVFPYMSELRSGLSLEQFQYLVVGGIAYSLGAIVYALKKPNPFPHIFGYHEIFHVLVMIAAYFHFLVNMQLCLSNT